MRSGAPAKARSFASGALLSVGAVLAFAVALCWPTWGTVTAAWVDSESRYTHGWLSVAIALWLLSRLLREYSPSFKQRPSFTYSAVLGLASVFWAVAETASLQWAAQLLALALPMLLALCVFNQPAAAAFCKVIPLPLCALPFWDAADLPMQQITIAGVSSILWLIQLPVNRDGSLVMTPRGAFDIEIGCNGLQMLLVAWTIAAALAVQQRVNAYQYVRMLATAGLIAIAANWLRITIVIVVGYVSDMQHYLVSNEHYSLGWSLFAVGMASFAWFAARRWSALPPGSAGPSATGARLPFAGWGPALVPLAAPLAAGIGPMLVLVSVSAPPPPCRVSPSVLANGLVVRNSDVDWATDPAGAVRWWAVDVRDIAGTAHWATLQWLEFDRISPALDMLLSRRAVIDWLDVEFRPDAIRDDGFSLVTGVDRNGQSWAMAWRLSVAGRSHAGALGARLRFAAMKLLGAPATIRLERLALPCALRCSEAQDDVAHLLRRLVPAGAASGRIAG